MMNDKKLERIAKSITALLFMASVILFFIMVLMNPWTWETGASYFEDDYSSDVADADVGITSVESIEIVKPDITTLVNTYKPVEIRASEAILEAPARVVEDVSVDVVEDSVENVIEPIDEPETVYFNIPLEEDLQDHIFALCEEYSVDPALIVAIIDKESDFEVSAVGDYGRSLGLMQIQPQWFQAEMAELGLDNLLDPYQNVTLGVSYISDLIGSGGTIEWVLMTYNGGPTYSRQMTESGLVSEYALEVMALRDGYSS